MSLQHLQDSRLEIVVNGHTCYSSPELKGMALTEQKRFLSLSGEAFDKHRPRKAEPSGQERDFYQLAFDLDGRFAKVKLYPLAWGKVEWNKSWFRRLMFLLHVQTHG